MIRKIHTLMVVHAHPDDEASSTGGLLRFAAEQGHTTIVVTCTQGDLGEVKMPGVRLYPRQDSADRQRLALIRQEELAQAAAILGVTYVYQLGYHDSGMAGWARALSSYCKKLYECAVIKKTIRHFPPSRPPVFSPPIACRVCSRGGGRSAIFI
jgi:LmbE family N-acetylglucosaminyl deacetylase